MAAEAVPPDIIDQFDESEPDQNLIDLTANLDLARNQILKRRLLDIVQSINNENDPTHRPLCITRSANSLNLIFGNSETRNIVAKNGLLIFGKNCSLELPGPIRIKKLVYLYGIPLMEKHENVNNFLGKSLHLTPVSDFRWIHYSGTQIRNGGRSLLVEFDDTVTLPGYFWYASPTCRQPKKVALWYPQMPVYCKKCLQPGHSFADCPNGPQRPVTLSYANVVKDVHKKTSQAQKSNVDDLTITMQTLPKSNVTKIDLSKQLEKTIELAPTEPTENDNSKNKTQKLPIIPFFSKADTFSNHFECEFEIENVKYDTTEQYLFSQRAQIVGDQVAYSKIMRNKLGRFAKKYGEEVTWPGTVDEWRTFAYGKLKIANTAKYEQNKKLRLTLFGTYPAILAEANPTDQFWGIGLRRDDQRVRSEKTWNGDNRMGFLLVELRDELMARIDFADEVDACKSSQSTVESNPLKNVSKRQITTPENGLAPKRQSVSEIFENNSIVNNNLN